MCVPAGDLGAGGARGGREKEEEEEGSALPTFPLPVDFFHPAHVAPPGSPPREADPRRRDPSRLASPASWASLRSPAVHSRDLCSQVGGRMEGGREGGTKGRMEG